MQQEMKGKVTVTISIISLLISIIAICVTCPNSEKLNFDYQGVLVGILSMLVTVLIGWNIYSIIDIKKIRDELYATKANSVFNAEKNNAITCHAVSDYYYHVLLKSDPLGVEYQFLYYRISELFHVSKIGDIETCNVIVKVLLEMIKTPEDIHILQSCKDRLIGLLSKVDGKENILKYNELIAIIARLGIKPRDNSKQF